MNVRSWPRAVIRHTLIAADQSVIDDIKSTAIHRYC